MDAILNNDAVLKVVADINMNAVGRRLAPSFDRRRKHRGFQFQQVSGNSGTCEDMEAANDPMYDPISMVC